MFKEELLTKIKENFFKDKTYKSKEIAVIKANFPDYEGNQVADFFSSKIAAEISLDSLLNEYEADHTACLFFMRPEPAAYFFGVYMYLGLLHEDKGIDFCVMLIDIMSASVIDSPEGVKWFFEVRSFFTDEQNETIKDFIDYVSENLSDHVLPFETGEARKHFH